MPPSDFPKCGSIAWLLISLAFECALSSLPVRLSLAVPSTAASISLGVFDQSGRLIRSLATCEPIENLPLGVNGPQITWDGLDDNQSPAPAGKYSIAGFAIPSSVKFSLESTLFNTLLSNDGTPLARSILAICHFDPPQLLVHIPSSEKIAIIILDEEGNPCSSYPLNPDEIPIASSASAKILRRDEQLVVHFNSPSRAPLSLPVDSKVSMAALGDFWVVVSQTDKKLLVGSLENGQILHQFPLPAQLSALAPLRDGSLVVSDSKSLWCIQKDLVQIIPLSDVLEIFDLAPAPENTFWLAGKKNTPADKSHPSFVRQYSADGKLLRELSISQNCEFIRLLGDSLSLRLGIVTSSCDGSRACAISAPPTAQVIPAESGETRIVSWATMFDHSIEFVDKPGFENTSPLPRGKKGSNPALFQLPPNELGPASNVKLIVRCKPTGAWLATSQGLDIIYLMKCSGPPAWHKTKDDRLSVLIPVSGAVYLAVISNLNKLIPISGGEIELQK